LNYYACKGFKLAAMGVVSGLPDLNELIEKGVLDSFCGSNGTTRIQDYKVAIAIMEKQVTQ
jgi:hypothetical protein